MTKEKIHKAEKQGGNVMITSQIILGGLVLMSAAMAIFAELTEEPHLNASDFTLAAAA